MTVPHYLIFKDYVVSWSLNGILSVLHKIKSEHKDKKRKSLEETKRSKRVEMNYEEQHYTWSQARLVWFHL